MRIGMSLTSSYSRQDDSKQVMDDLIARVELMAELGFDSSGRYLFALRPADDVRPSGLPPQAAVTVWEVASGRVALDLPQSDGVVAIDFSRDGNALAASSGTGNLRVWDLASGVSRRVVVGDPGPVAFSTDGRWVVVGLQSFSVFDASTLREAAHVDLGGEIGAFAFRSDDRLLAVHRSVGGEQSNVVELHRWRVDDVLAEACRRIPLSAAQAQWTQLLPDRPLPRVCASGNGE